MRNRLSLFSECAFIALLCAAFPIALLGQTGQTERFNGRDAVAGEIIVRFRDGAVPVSESDRADVVTTKTLAPSRAMLLRSAGRNVAELMREYSARSDVLYAEPNYLWRKEDVPNDVFFDQQWSLKNTAQPILGQVGVFGADIRAVPAWDIAQGSRSFVIGIVDSGIDYNHPDLAANMWTAPRAFTVTIDGQSITCAAGTHGFNAINRTCDPMDDDPDRHGTLVASIIGADGDNGTGISGISRVASMMALKFIGPSGFGSTADAIAAIQFAIQVKTVLGVDANVRILNNSWGSTTFSSALLDAVNASNASNMLFVAAAGNDSTNTDVTPHYPSSYTAPNVISVAATDNRDVLDPISNFGKASVDLAAPGTNIASAKSATSYLFESGTSLASAVVSGAAGLVLSGCTTLTTAQLRTSLLNSVDVLTALQPITVTGGRLNVLNALSNCIGSFPPLFNLKSSSPFVLAGDSGIGSATITLNPLPSFSGSVTLSVSAPAGISASLGSTELNGGLLSTTLTLSAGAVPPGAYVIHVTGTDSGVERSPGMVFIVGIPLSTGQNLSATWSPDTSQVDRFKTTLPPGLADWYRLTATSSGTLNIALLVFSSFGNFLRVLDSSGNLLAIDNTTVNNTLEINGLAVTAGTYYIVASAAPTLPSNYSLAVNAPQLRSLIPNSGQQGFSVDVQLSGAQFASGLAVDAGPDITVSNVMVQNPGLATATFAIGATAALGARNVSVTTPAGQSNSIPFTVVRPKPVITSITPSSGVVGTSVDISILGAYFNDAVVDLAGTTSGVTLDNIVAVSTTLITARVNIPVNASFIGILIRVTTLGGSVTSTFQIIPPPPVLTSLTPLSGGLGTIVTVTLTGTNLTSPMTVDAGSGITTQVLTITSGTTATVRFTISPTTTLGIRNVSVTTPGGTSSSVIFNVSPGPGPTLTSISPSVGPQTTTRNFDVRGTNFTTGLTFDAGPDIIATAITIVSGTQITVTLQVGSTAALGPRNITITTPGGTSNVLVFTVLPPPPTLTSMTPSSGPQESAVIVTFTGTNFVAGMTVSASPLAVTGLVISDSTSATALVTIPVSTPTGNKNVSVTTASGTSAPLLFNVLPGIPTLTEVRPALLIRGRDNAVTLIGTNFATGSTTISSVPNVSIAITSLSGGSINATFSVSLSAALGPQSITVTTPGGTTSAVSVTIVDPFPDLSTNATNNPFYAGLSGVINLSLFNNGTAAATAPITITDQLPSELTFISGGGNGFSCSASGQLVTCVYSGAPFTPLSIATFPVNVTIGPSAPLTVTHTVTAIHPADLITSNNSITASINIQQLPTPTFTFTPFLAMPGQQSTLSLSLPVLLPQDVTGTLTLTFSSSASNPADDPAIQFATGGRQVSFVIPANNFQARFGASSATSIGYQTGTVAGSIGFNGTLKAGSAERSFSSPSNSSSLIINPIAPVLQSVRADSQSGFAILITSFSTSRSMSELRLQFSTSPVVQPSCGSVSGCTVAGSGLTLDVKTLFDSWFSGNSQFGGLSTLRLPLEFHGVRGSVSVTLKNSVGSSNTIFLNLP